jgi:HEAT repeat protein
MAPLSDKGSDYTTLVEEGLEAVLSSRGSSLSDINEILQIGYALPTTAALLQSLRAGAESEDPYIRRALQRELIVRGDISQLPAVVNFLTSGTATGGEEYPLLYAIASRLNDKRAVPMISPLLRSSDPAKRSAGLQALWHIADAQAIPVLVDHLGDTDDDACYYAVRGLAEITHQNPWGPSPAEFQEHESKYIDHWRAWAAENFPKQATHD